MKRFSIVVCIISFVTSLSFAQQSGVRLNGNIADLTPASKGSVLVLVVSVLNVEQFKTSSNFSAQATVIESRWEGRTNLKSWNAKLKIDGEQFRDSVELGQELPKGAIAPNRIILIMVQVEGFENEVPVLKLLDIRRDY